MAKNTPVPLNRTERILRSMIASAIGLSVLGLIATIIAISSDFDRTQGIWLTVTVLPYVGILIAAVLLLVLTVIYVVRRRRLAQRDS